MIDETQSFRPAAGLPEAEKRRLVAEAMAPLTPAEMEQWQQNRTNDLAGSQLKSKLRELALALAAWQHDAVAAQIKKGNLPEWVFDKDRQDEARALIKDGGYHFAGSGFHWEFRRGEQVLSVFEAKVNGKAV